MTGANNDSAWPGIQLQINAAATDVRMLAVDAALGKAVLARLGVTERSTLGAIAANTGGLVVDHGWLRILGGGHDGLPDLSEANTLAGAPPPFLVIAQDVLGGRFAVDGGGLGVSPGEVCYWGPDTLSWAGIGGGHTAFVSWALGGGLEEFYSDLRWPGWEHETGALRLDEGISVYPPPFTTRGRDVATASRHPVLYAELVDFYADMARQLGGLGEGATFRMTITETSSDAGHPED